MSDTKQKRILVIYEVLEATPPRSDHTWMRGQADWRDEFQVVSCLKKLGYDVRMFGVFNDIEGLVRDIKEWQPDLVFNLLEAFNNDRDKESHLVAMLELLGVSYTGVGAKGLSLCKDKALSKLILANKNILVPKYIVSPAAQPLAKLADDFPLPVIVKPLGFEGSEAIHQCSIAQSSEDAMERMTYLHEKYETDVIIEEFIAGRDMYVGLLGNLRIQTLSPVELSFSKSKDEDAAASHRIASFQAKWNRDYQKRHGIVRTDCTDPMLARRLQIEAKKIYKVLGLQGYARIDFRVDAHNQIYFIEANPNPAVNNQDEFALSAKKSGIEHEDLIRKIVKLGLNSAS